MSTGTSAASSTTPGRCRDGTRATPSTRWLPHEDEAVLDALHERLTAPDIYALGLVPGRTPVSIKKRCIRLRKQQSEVTEQCGSSQSTSGTKNRRRDGRGLTSTAAPDESRQTSTREPATPAATQESRHAKRRDSTESSKQRPSRTSETKATKSGRQKTRHTSDRGTVPKYDTKGNRMTHAQRQDMYNESLHHEHIETLSKMQQQRERMAGHATHDHVVLGEDGIEEIPRSPSFRKKFAFQIEKLRSRERSAAEVEAGRLQKKSSAVPSDTKSQSSKPETSAAMDCERPNSMMNPTTRPPEFAAFSTDKLMASWKRRRAAVQRGRLKANAIAARVKSKGMFTGSESSDEDGSEDEEGEVISGRGKEGDVSEVKGEEEEPGDETEDEDEQTNEGSEDDVVSSEDEIASAAPSIEQEASTPADGDAHTSEESNDQGESKSEESEADHDSEEDVQPRQSQSMGTGKEVDHHTIAMAEQSEDEEKPFDHSDNGEESEAASEVDEDDDGTLVDPFAIYDRSSHEVPTTTQHEIKGSSDDDTASETSDSEGESETEKKSDSEEQNDRSDSSDSDMESDDQALDAKEAGRSISTPKLHEKQAQPSMPQVTSKPLPTTTPEHRKRKVARKMQIPVSPHSSDSELSSASDDSSAGSSDDSSDDDKPMPKRRKLAKA